MQLTLRTLFTLVFAAVLAVEASSVFAAGPLDFSVHKLESGRPGPTLLVFGGIQGDEPGGFCSASLLATLYRIESGAVWVVPNLNFQSIIHCSRGAYGDMNRKFKSIRKDDPDYLTIQRVKKLITDERVDLVLNLHDGSGFYRPHHISEMLNPRRWGQSVIIDQASIEARSFGQLDELARKVVASVNRDLLEPEHLYHVKNTETRLGDLEMEKTLTYFAIQQGKPAFGIEASKDFNAEQRTYYHLHAIEAFMEFAGVRFSRDFPLSVEHISRALNTNVYLSFYDNRILLDLADVRDKLHFLPLKKNSAVSFTSSNPLLTLVGEAKLYQVYFGNKALTSIHPQYFEYDPSIRSIGVYVDGEKLEVGLGGKVVARESFLVAPRRNHRINVIGFDNRHLRNEAGLPLRKQDIQERFSVDKGGRVYRVEVYLGDKFAGMVLVEFAQEGEALTVDAAPSLLRGQGCAPTPRCIDAGR